MLLEKNFTIADKEKFQSKYLKQSGTTDHWEEITIERWLEDEEIPWFAHLDKMIELASKAAGLNDRNYHREASVLWEMVEQIKDMILEHLDPPFGW
tara:strand:- start:61 stop:348 length:288 start_codon:yes stop_codon:yes gene_type:complete